MMNFLTIFAIQILLMIVGYLITLLIKISNKIEAMGLAYLLGSGLITILFLVNHFLLNFSLDAINFLFAVVISISFLLAIILIWQKQKLVFLVDFAKIKTAFQNLNCFEKFILAFLILILGYTLLENFVWPVTYWDALALYDFRARVMAINGNMLEGIELGYFFQYPPYTSFLHVFGYIFAAERVKVAYSFIYFSLLTVFYSLLKRKQNNVVALLGTLLLALNGFMFSHATMAYTNLAYVVFVSLGLIYLNFWIFSQKKADLIIGAILVALSTWVRASDPFWYLGILMILFGLVKNKKQIRLALGLIFFTLLLYKFWDFFLASMNVLANSKSSREKAYFDALFGGQGNIFDFLKSLPGILAYFWQNTIVTIKYLLPASLFAVYYDFKYKNKLNLFLYFLIASALVLILLGIIIFSLFYESWNLIGESLQRMSMILIPLLIFTIFNSNIWKENVFKNKK